MRPVDRGPVPTNSDGIDIVFKVYSDARDHLINRLGDFCSYCEIAIHTCIDVEHVQPKVPNPHLTKTWSNFLLACKNCNSIKGHDPIDVSDYLWSDLDNTAMALVYTLDCPPSVNSSLQTHQCALAEKTITLTGLDRQPGHPKYSNRDRRWLKRREAWGNALIAFNNLASIDTPEMRQQIVATAVARGFWSVWMQVFNADADMRQRLISGFTGTSASCFRPSTSPIPRTGGQV